jgi:1-acyl-sn-glycerol-3-phosphate acyltransferase
MIDALENGDFLIPFPEGTRNLEEGLLPFKSGIYHLAKNYPDAQMIPVWIANLNRVMPNGHFLPLPLLWRLHVRLNKQGLIDLDT